MKSFQLSVVPWKSTIPFIVKIHIDKHYSPEMGTKKTHGMI